MSPVTEWIWSDQEGAMEKRDADNYIKKIERNDIVEKICIPERMSRQQ